MEENNQNNQNNEKITTEEIKQEAVNTANQVKETLKNTDLKQDANATKGFVSNLFKNPIQEIEKVATSTKNEFLKIAIIVFVVWLVATLIGEVVGIFKSYSYYSSLYSTVGSFFKSSVNNVLSVIKGVLAPVLSVVVLSAIAYFMGKDKKKPFINIATSVIVAKIPVVIAEIVSLLTLFSSQALKLTSPFSSFCGIISTILLYFTLKAMYEEKEDNTFVKKFAIIMGIYYIARFIISFLGIYM